MAYKKEIDLLIDKPLNELTEEEAQIVIEWKAKKKLEEFKSEEHYKELQKQADLSASEMKKQTDVAIKTLDDLKQQALAFYNEQ